MKIKKQNNPQLDKWAEDSINLLKKYKYLPKKYKSSHNLYLILGTILFIGIILSVIGIYGIGTDAFKSINNQTVNLKPQISAPTTNNNEYAFIINNTQQPYNCTIEIYNNIIVPGVNSS